MAKVGYKYWDQMYSKYVVIECGVLESDTFECHNANILPIGHYDATSLSWWKKEEDEGGFVLID